MSTLLLLLVAVNVVMSAVMAVQAWRYGRSVLTPARPDLPVSVLVPTEGDDPRLPEVLAAIEASPWTGPREVLVCGPALAGEPPPGVNRKAFFLAAGAARARFPTLVVVDSRVVLAPDALARLVGAREAGGAAAVFGSSRAVPEGALLGALSDHLARGHAQAWPVLAGLAATTDDPPPASGSLVAVDAERLARVGGFGALVDRVADDLVLAERLATTGRVLFAEIDAPVRMGAVGWRAWFDRWVRWIRVGVSTSPARALSYPLLLAPFPLAVMFAGAATGNGAGPWVWGAVAALVVARLGLGLSRGDRSAWVGPLADWVLFAASAVAAASTKVEWRGRTLYLAEGGRLTDTPRRGVSPLAFALLALFALIGLGMRADGRVPPGADGLFVFTEGILVALALRRWGLLVVVALAGFLAEAVGTATGLPFGEYVYLDALGPKVLDAPIAMAPTWLAAVGGAVGLARGRWVEATVLLVLTDVVLDPLAAGPLGYWAWAHGGFWYGIPTQNFVGWAIVGAPLCWLVSKAPSSWVLPAIGWLNLTFFGALAAWNGLWGPLFVAIATALWCLYVPPPEAAHSQARTNP